MYLMAQVSTRLQYRSETLARDSSPMPGAIIKQNLPALLPDRHQKVFSR